MPDLLACPALRQTPERLEPKRAYRKEKLLGMSTGSAGSLAKRFTSLLRPSSSKHSSAGTPVPDAGRPSAGGRPLTRTHSGSSYSSGTFNQYEEPSSRKSSSSSGSFFRQHHHHHHHVGPDGAGVFHSQPSLSSPGSALGSGSALHQPQPQPSAGPWFKRNHSASSHHLHGGFAAGHTQNALPMGDPGPEERAGYAVHPRGLSDTTDPASSSSSSLSSSSGGAGGSRKRSGNWSFSMARSSTRSSFNEGSFSPPGGTSMGSGWPGASSEPRRMSEDSSAASMHTTIIEEPTSEGRFAGIPAGGPSATTPSTTAAMVVPPPCSFLHDREADFDVAHTGAEGGDHGRQDRRGSVSSAASASLGLGTVSPPPGGLHASAENPATSAPEMDPALSWKKRISISVKKKRRDPALSQ
ncbi:hypothetical protein H696_05845 [Fonticula alba]|uniref:Uncharacterized protein n=1 Tax=Fonticula alba TaxID=691883 RepID=A0A058Z0R8_FONAL|nr:hypothetical protein H696_05845 [Fonticula alba]KCV67736.1 hypothetical protein H696_05845 [Fonticula alba]|eukprot:XP_009497920.1 hypothetical protein H696_05845 [Fonticula alba]